MARNFTGSTVNARAAILPGRFWKAGTRVTGKYIRTYTTIVDGDSLQIHQFATFGDLQVPLNSDGKFDENGKLTKLDKFAVGNLAGFDMAVQDLKTQGFDFFRTTDYVTIECTEVQQALQSGFSDMPLFSVSIADRPPAPKVVPAAS